MPWNAWCIIINRVEGKVSGRDVVRRLLPVLGSQLEELGGAFSGGPGSGHRLACGWFGCRALLHGAGVAAGRLKAAFLANRKG